MIAGFDDKGDNVCWQLEIQGFVLPFHTGDVTIDESDYNFIEVRNVGNTKYLVDGGKSLFPGDTMQLGSSNDINKVIFRHTFKKTDCVIEAEGTCCDEPRLEVYGVKTRLCPPIKCPKH